MCNDKRKFEAFNKDDRTKMYTAADYSIKLSGSNDIKLNLRVNGRDSIKVQNALCVPEL